MAEPDPSPLGRPGNGALLRLGTGDVWAEVCRDCGALLPPYDTEARQLHDTWDRLVKALLGAQVRGASWH